MSISEVLTSFLPGNTTLASNSHYGKDQDAINSLAQTKIVSIGKPINSTSLPKGIIYIYDEQTEASLLIQLIQIACDKLFGSPEKFNTQPSDGLKTYARAASPRTLQSPTPNWFLYDQDTTYIHPLDGSTPLKKVSSDRTTTLPEVPSLKRNFGMHDLPNMALLQETTLNNG